MDREQYEKDLAERQRKHLESVRLNQHWQPCLHDSCTNCLGTGVGKDGRPCIHGISCPCPKCSPVCFSSDGAMAWGGQHSLSFPQSQITMHTGNSHITYTR